ncbi:MAG: hypothetical protein LAT84_02880 [Balneolia bacterium]|nr:hypothetical protein [Balneolia bacterium]
MNKTQSADIMIFIGSFSFRAAEGSDGKFEIISRNKSLHEAENAFRSKIKEYFASQPGLLPAKIYLLDIIEIEETAKPALLFFEKVSVGEDEEKSAVFFSPLPLRESHATTWSASMPGNPELFLEIE